MSKRGHFLENLRFIHNWLAPCLSLILMLLFTACQGLGLPATGGLSRQLTAAPSAAPTETLPSVSTATVAPAASTLTARPSPTTAQPVARQAVNTPTPDNPGQQQFSISTANHVKPEDVLKEIYFGPGGGGFGCAAASPKPTIEKFYTDRDVFELMEPAGLVGCNWHGIEDVTLTVLYPDGKTFNETLRTGEDDSGIYFVIVKFAPDFHDPAGTYTFTLKGPDGQVEETVPYVQPKAARLVFDEKNNRLILFHFSPNEKIRLFAYQNSQFAGWNSYQVNGEGAGYIGIETGYQYAVVGEKSGEVDLQNDYPFADISPFIIHIYDPCPGAPEVRLLDYSNARVTYTDGRSLRIRETPGETGNVITQIKEGTTVQVESGPVCKDGMNWWNVMVDLHTYGWAAEGDMNSYYLEPAP